MKKFIIFIGLLLAGGLLARDIAVFAKGEFIVLDAMGSPPARPADPAKAAFLAAFEAERAHPAAFPVADNLSNPPAWGKTIAGAGGTIQYHGSFAGGFVVRVALNGLAPNHRYILTLNGKPDLPGNNRLVDPVPGNETERYYDFLTATTDTAGRYEATFGILLPAGPYGVRFYVKDTDDFKIVLYRDYFRFTVD